MTEKRKTPWNLFLLLLLLIEILSYYMGGLFLFGVFFASTFWRKMQNIFGECCISKLEKVAKPRPAVILPATSHCRPYLVVTE